MVKVLARSFLAFVSLSFVADCGCAAPSAAPRTVSGFATKAEAGGLLSVVFFGGSLTWGANASNPDTTSYRGLMMRWLRERYPQASFAFHDAAIGGTGSQLGLFRLERDVLAHQPDLVFLDFTVNDNLYGVTDPSLALYERVLRELLAASAVVPVLMCGYPEIAAAAAPPPPRYAAHRRLTEAYGLIPADTIRVARAAVAAGRASPDELYSIGRDHIHPDDAGYALFFEAARDAYLQAASSAALSAPPANPVFPDLFPAHERRCLVDTPLPAGWKRAKTYRTAMWHDGLSSRWMGDVACAGPGAAPLELVFQGSVAGLFGERNPLTAPFRVWIDGQPVAQPRSTAEDKFLWCIDTTRFGSPASGAGNLYAWTVLATDLVDGDHTLKIEPIFTGAHEKAELRIESLCSAGRQ